MKTLLKFFLFLLLFVVTIAGIGVFLPSAIHVERSIVIDAPAQFIHSKLNGFADYNQWSPWAAKDPNANYVLDGSENGVGAKLMWTSQVREVGTGSQEIVAVADDKISILLSLEGMQPSKLAYLIEEVDTGTKVTWTMDVDMGNDLLGRYIGLFFDKMLGEEYDKGLLSLKTFIEGLDVYNNDIAIEEIEAKWYISITEYVDNDPGLISTKMASNYGEIYSFIENEGLEPNGFPFAFYHNYTEVGMDIECALGISDSLTISDSRIKLGYLSATRAVKAVHFGSFDNLEATHSEIGEFIAFKKLETLGAPFEVYITDPEMEADTSKWITHIYYPIK